MEPREEREEETEEETGSRTGQLDEELDLKLEAALAGATPQLLSHEIAKIASQYDPIDLAYAAVRLPSAARVLLYENLSDLSAKMIFMVNTGPSTRAAIFRQLSDQEIKNLVEKMPLDEAVWVLEDMSDRRRRRTLDLLDSKKRGRILELQKHDRDSASRLMTHEFFAFDMNTTMQEVAAHIRDNPGIDLTKQIFVLNSEKELVGYVPSRALIISPPHIQLRQVTCPVHHTVMADTSRDEVVDLAERYKISSLPVVDEQRRLIGVITDDEIVEAMEDIADNTIASIGGSAEEVGEYEALWKRFIYRAPWLIVTLFAGLVSTAVMAHFYGRAWFSLIPLFIPLITGMSGNVGIQCSTILVRWMSAGELSHSARRTAMIKELTIGTSIGLIFGILCGLVIWGLNTFGIHELGENPIGIVVTIACGVFGACLTATVLGTFSPFFFARFGVDPAVASGPIVTACNDVLSTLSFFLIARLIFTFL